MEKDDGVTAVDFPDTYLVDVSFEDTKTSADKIVASLKRAQLTVEKKIKFIEKKPNTGNDIKQ